MSKSISIFVPGRLCLFGEHSDWAGTYMLQNSELLEGQAIVSGINLGIYADVEINDSFYIKSVTTDGKTEEFSCEMDVRILKENAAVPFLFSYCCGVAAYMRENYHVGGLKINITKVTLPMKKGLSSSAAVCCLVAKAFNEIYDLHISTRGIMQIAYRGELLTGSRCGRLDQACAYGERPVLMHFAYSEIEVEKIKVGKNLYWVIADLCAGKDTKKILSSLGRAYPFATNDIERQEQEALGIDNHRIIALAKTAIENGNAEELGKIMCEAQKVFDEKVAPACPEELSSPMLHSILSDTNIQQWIYGGKGVGSQGDGSVQFLAKDEYSQQQLIYYLKNEAKMEPFPFTLSAGGKIKKAIIPIAGNGTRMFPESLFVKKALLPIVDENEVVKPVLLCMLEELVEAEIDDIYLIVGEDEKETYSKLFDFDVSEVYEESLPNNVRYYYRRIKEIGNHIHLVVQHEKYGFGHAVFQARQYLKGEPALLMLGDFIYKSNNDISCTQQTINAYNMSGGKSVVSIKKVQFEDSVNYGVIHGSFLSDSSNIMEVDNIVEKPGKEKASLELSVDGSCYATFGQYVLTEEVFNHLEQQIDRLNQNIYEVKMIKEIDLTSALKIQAEHNELVAVEIDGESYDVGIPQKYYETFLKFHG